MNLFHELIGLVSGALGLSVAAPQLYKIIKNKNRDGVSITTWVIALSSFGLWAGYSIRYNSISQLLTNTIAIILTSILVYVLLKETKNSYLGVAIILGVTLTSVAVGYISYEIIMNTALLVMLLLGRIPQIIESRKSYIKHTLTSVSQTTYILVILSSVGWGSYGILTGLWQNTVASSVNILASFIILYYEKQNQKNIVKTLKN